MWYNNSMNKTSKQRKQIVTQAEANQKLEGLKVSQDSRKIADNYVTGKVTAKEAAEKIKARYGAL